MEIESDNNKTGKQRARTVLGRNYARTKLRNNRNLRTTRSHNTRNMSSQRHRLSANAGEDVDVVANLNLNNNVRNNPNNAVQDIYNGNVIDGEKSDQAICFGNFSREVYNAICLRLGDTIHIPEDSLQALFNDMQLFPSKSQVSKMLQCARQCSRRNGAKEYLTFGEFCWFVREMQGQNVPKQNRKNSLSKINNKCTSKCEVFLGGSCNPTTWRADVAIPELKKYGITYYNPQVSMWAPELLAQEHDAKQTAEVLLFVIDSQTRSTGSMLEVAYLVSAGRCVVVVAQSYKKGQNIIGEPITDKEYSDLMEAQRSLLHLIKTKGVKIHSSLTTAVQCTASILRNTTNDEQVTQNFEKLREIYDSYDGKMNLYNVLDAYRKLMNCSLEINKLCKHLSSEDINNIKNSNITYEKFCLLMAELSKNDGKDFNGTDVWATQSFHRQCSTNNNTCMVELPANLKFANVTQSYDVYLGGSVSSKIPWRDEIAVPLLEKHGLEYYNPAIREPNDAEEDVLQWRKSIESSRVLLFVITNDTRSLTSMVLASHYIGMGREIVLCVQQLPTESCVVANETLTSHAIKDYNRARTYLVDLAERKQIPLYRNITEAVNCVIDKCKKR